MSRAVSRRPRAWRGFSLIELTITLVVMGVLGLLASFAFSGTEGASVARGQSRANEVREALRYFALANKRLPCPDSDGDGHENCAAGEFGFVPYLTLGLEDAARERMYYAVHRGSGGDLAALEERTGDTEGQPGFRGYGDLIRALENISVTSVSAARLRVAAVLPNGASDCGNATHPAFALIAPNADRDGDGDARDGVNAQNGSCVASPLQSGSSSYDDVVLSESVDALIEWLFKHHVH